jgi:hypothetical protein
MGDRAELPHQLWRRGENKRLFRGARLRVPVSTPFDSQCLDMLVRQANENQDDKPGTEKMACSLTTRPQTLDLILTAGAVSLLQLATSA